MNDFDDLLTLNRSEHAEQNDGLMRISAIPGVMCYRQNTGTAWQGKDVTPPVGEYVRITPGMKVLAASRPIDFGISGGGDIVGHKRGKAFQAEMKTTHGAHKKHQQAFGRVWTERGGVYILARSAAELEDKVSAIR
jgi:hypothetical protein